VFLFPLLHPAAALRASAMKDTLREDFAKLPVLLEEPLPGPARAESASPGDPADQLDFFG